MSVFVKTFELKTMILCVDFKTMEKLREETEKALYGVMISKNAPEVFVANYFNKKGFQLCKNHPPNIWTIGQPDFYFIKKNKKIWVEVKSEHSTIQPNQLYWALTHQNEKVIFAIVIEEHSNTIKKMCEKIKVPLPKKVDVQ